MFSIAFVAAALTFTRSAHAQTPAPTTGLTPVATPALTQFPYKVVIYGPQTSVAGLPITFTLDYTWVAAPTAREGAGIVLTYDGATLVSVTSVSGAAPTDAGPQTTQSENFGLNGDNGTLRIVVQPPPGFIGPLGVGFYVRGTEIGLPQGTVAGATTLVALPGSMIIIGEVPATAGEYVSVEALNPTTLQPVTCDTATSRPTEAPDLSHFGLIVAPSCVQQASGNLRICWSPNTPPSPPPAVDTRACYTALTFSEGLHDLGLISATVQETTPNAGGPTAVTSPIAGPATGDGASAGHGGRAPVALALAIAALGALTLGGPVLLRQRR